jgi:hypothetical protein
MKPPESHRGALIKTLGPDHYQGITKRGELLATRAANSTRRLRDRLLRDYPADNAAITLAQKLDTCNARTPCRSPACPRCAQAAQENFVATVTAYTRERRAMLAAVRNRSRPQVTFAAVTIVPGSLASLPGYLGAPTVDQVHRWFTDRLAGARLTLLVGVLEVQFVSCPRFPSQWLWHLHGLVETRNIDQVGRRLRALFPASSLVPRPIQIKPWDDSRRWLRYCLKLELRRRVGIGAMSRFNMGQQKPRHCRGTKSLRLDSKEFLELVSFLDSIRLDDRIITKGSQLRASSNGCNLVKMRRPKRMKNKASDAESPTRHAKQLKTG